MKEAEDNIFEDLFRERLGDYEEAPPPQAWDKIAPQIGHNGLPYWRYLLPLLLLLLVSGGIWLGWEGVFDTANLQANRLEKNEPSVALSEGGKLEEYAVKQEKYNADPVENEFVNEELRTEDLVPNKGENIDNQTVNDKILKTQTTKNTDYKRSDDGGAVLLKSLISNNKPSKNTLTTSLKNSDKEEKEMSLATLTPCLTCVTIADIEIKTIPKERKRPPRFIEYELYAAPIYSYGRIATNQSDDWLVSSPDGVQQFSTGNLGIKVGLNKRFGLGQGKRLGVLAGVEYSLLRKEVSIDLTSAKPIDYHSCPDSLGIWHVQPIFETVQHKQQVTAHLLGVRLGADYAPFTGKPNQRIVFGMGLDAMIHNNTNSSTFDLRNGQLLHPLGYLAYEWRHELSDRMFLKFSPNLTYYFSSLLANGSTFGAKPYTVGIKLSLGIKSKVNQIKK